MPQSITCHLFLVTYCYLLKIPYNRIMILNDFKDFPKTGRILGIDWGARRMGIAISTPDRSFVFPYLQLQIRNQKSEIKNIVEIIESEKIVGIVVGLPLYADGTDSDTTRMVRAFADQLAAATDAPIVFMDESLTSVAAEEIVGAHGNTPGVGAYGIRPKKCKEIDSTAAAVILENAIAMMRRGDIKQKAG